MTQYYKDYKNCVHEFFNVVESFILDEIYTLRYALKI
jgi:hypothetical protein